MHFFEPMKMGTYKCARLQFTVHDECAGARARAIMKWNEKKRRRKIKCRQQKLHFATLYIYSLFIFIFNVDLLFFFVQCCTACVHVNETKINILRVCVFVCSVPATMRRRTTTTRVVKASQMFGPTVYSVGAHTDLHRHNFLLSFCRIEPFLTTLTANLQIKTNILKFNIMTIFFYDDDHCCSFSVP